LQGKLFEAKVTLESEQQVLWADQEVIMSIMRYLSSKELSHNEYDALEVFAPHWTKGIVWKSISQAKPPISCAAGFISGEKWAIYGYDITGRAGMIGDTLNRDGVPTIALVVSVSVYLKGSRKRGTCLLYYYPAEGCYRLTELDRYINRSDVQYEDLELLTAADKVVLDAIFDRVMNNNKLV
jgi:hypothetical protein